MQKAIIQRHANFTVPIKNDRDVTEDELKSHHLLLIGRPGSNAAIKRFQSALPIEFGSRSFIVEKETYAHPGSAVLAAAANPLKQRFSLVVFAGLDAESTLNSISAWQSRGGASAEVVVLPNTGKAKPLIMPAKDLVKELEPAMQLTGRKDSDATGGR